MNCFHLSDIKYNELITDTEERCKNNYTLTSVAKGNVCRSVGLSHFFLKPLYSTTTFYRYTYKI